MKRTFVFAYIALFLFFALPKGGSSSEAATAEPSPATTMLLTAAPSAAPAEEKITVLIDGCAAEKDMQEYLIGVVAAEMPAAFELEALKAQAVAARTYAMYCSGKHSDADVCTDPGCCQAWMSEAAMRSSWGESYQLYLDKVSSAVAATAGEYIIYEGKPIFAAFHSSSAAYTEDCGEVWSPLPYLVSVTSPENSGTVPNYTSAVQCSPLDFRDTLLSAHPDADFSGDMSGWIGALTRDESRRVSSAVLGGISIAGTELRSLFSLRSTAFTLEFTQGVFFFTVTGYGHGVGMSQYGANTMAAQGSGYADILAHYYPGTALVS